MGGCTNTAPLTALQDSPQWSRATFFTADPAQSFPPIPPGARIRSITLIVDEGTDSSSLQDPEGIGLAVVDNIDINGQLITRGTGTAPNSDNDDGRREDEDVDWKSMDVAPGQTADMPVAADANGLSIGGDWALAPFRRARSTMASWWSSRSTIPRVCWSARRCRLWVA